MTLLCTELIPKSATETKAVTPEPVDQQMPLVEAPSRRAERRMALTWAVSGSWQSGSYDSPTSLLWIRQTCLHSVPLQ